MTRTHPAGDLKVFSTLLHNQIASSLCSPVTLPWALCHKRSSPPTIQVLFLATKSWRVVHSSESNQLWIWACPVADYHYLIIISGHTLHGCFFTLFSPSACLLIHSHICWFVIFKPPNQYFPKCSLAEGNKTRGKEDGRYAHFSPHRLFVQ